MTTWKICLSNSCVPVYVILLSVEVEFLQFTFVIFNEDVSNYRVRQLNPFLSIESPVPRHHEVGVEAGEGVPGRTDGHVGEVQVRDGESLYGGGDRTVSPAREGLLDQHSGSDEAGDDDTQPE